MLATSYSGLLAVCLAAVLAAGCGRDEQPRERSARAAADTSSSRPSRRNYVVQPVANPGIVSGVVRSTGPTPTVEPLSVTLDPGACAAAQSDRPFVPGPDDGIAGAVVYLDSIQAGKDWPRLTIEQRTISQEGCTYTPRHLAVPVGETVYFRNNDPVAHNVRVESGYKILLNVAQPNPGEVDSMPVSASGALSVACDYHPWMFSSVFVTPNPYYAVTDSNGSFQIDDVPPGDYRLVAWFPDPVSRPLLDESGRLVRYAFGRPYIATSQVHITGGKGSSVALQFTWREGDKK